MSPATTTCRHLLDLVDTSDTNTQMRLGSALSYTYCLQRISITANTVDNRLRREEFTHPRRRPRRRDSEEFRERRALCKEDINVFGELARRGKRL